MLDKGGILNLYGADYKIRWRGILGFFRSLFASFRGFHGKKSAAATCISPSVSEVGVDLANFRSAISDIREEMKDPFARVIDENFAPIFVFHGRGGLTCRPTNLTGPDT